MKTTLSLGLMVAVASTLAACSSDEEGAPRTPTAGSGSVGTAGTGSGNAGSGGRGGSGGGTGAITGGAGGGSAVAFNYGPLVTVTAAGAVANVEEATTGIDGNTFLAQSVEMEVDAVAAHRDGALCFSGTTAVVPNDMSYGTHWGAELGINLKVGLPAGAVAPAADAGADAGGPALVPDPAGWPYGNVIGFSYKLEGNNPAAADRGVPASRLRFKALPVGSLGANDTYCSNREPEDQDVENVLFSDITFQCWTPALPGIGPEAATINRVMPGMPPTVITPPNPRALQQISWQIASDILATVPEPIPFDFCVTELKPILAAP